MGKSVVTKLTEETQQSSSSRLGIISSIETQLSGRQVVAFHSSFVYPSYIDDSDADVIEDLLRSNNRKQGLTLIINSPGGLPLSAERIINVCREYSESDFEVIVPKMAKSAATMICFGASKIWMSKTGELGPIDPQVTLKVDGRWKQYSVHNIIRSYESLVEQAVVSEGNIEPYLQQLQRFDARDIAQHKQMIALAETIAIEHLQSGMLSGKTELEIRDLILPFTDPEETLEHGRPIGIETARKSGLAVEEIKLDSKLWEYVSELHLRSDWYVTNMALKIFETKHTSLEIQIPDAYR